MTSQSTTPASTIDHFSWDRVKMIARYYYPILRIQIITYPILSLIAGILGLFSFSTIDSILSQVAPPSIFKGIMFMAVGLVSTAQTFLFYFSPAPFIKAKRDVDMQIPALWSEKATFVLLYIFVAIPILLYMPQLLINMAHDIIATPYEFTKLFTDGSITFGSMHLSISSFSNMIPMAVFAFVLFRSPKPSFGAPAGFAILALIMMGVIAGVGGLILFTSSAFNAGDPLTTGQNIDIAHDILKDNIISTIEYVIGIGSILFVGLFAWLTARTFKNLQI